MKPTLHALHRVGITLLAAAVLIATPGCRVVSNTAQMPARTVAVIFPGGKKDQPELGALQQALMRLSDTYIGETMQSVDELAGEPGSPFSHRDALQFELSSATAAVGVATRENPYAGMVDMVTLVTLTRMDLVRYQHSTTNGALFDKWVARVIPVESNAWNLAGQVLSDQQLAGLRESIDEYFKTHHEGKHSWLLDPVRMASALPRTLEKKKQGQGLMTLTAFDPFASLDPAVREVMETRLFAERAMYTLQRMPWLLRYQVELLVLDVTAQPEVARALADATTLSASVDRASRAAEEISRTVEALPGQIASERQAIVTALQDQEGQLNALFRSGTGFSDSLSTTITNFNALMVRFGVGVPVTNPPPPDPNAQPFNILDYAQTAERVTAMASQLNQTITELNASVDSPAVEALSNRAKTDVRGLLNHAFLLVAGLVVLLLVCAVLYRRLTGRRPAP